MPQELKRLIERWQNIKPREPEEMYPRWVLWLREWQKDHKDLRKYSYIDFLEWKGENVLPHREKSTDVDKC